MPHLLNLTAYNAVPLGRPAEKACAAAYKVYSQSPLNTYFQHTFLNYFSYVTLIGIGKGSFFKTGVLKKFHMRTRLP